MNLRHKDVPGAYGIYDRCNDLFSGVDRKEPNWTDQRRRHRLGSLCAGDPWTASDRAGDCTGNRRNPDIGREKHKNRIKIFCKALEGPALRGRFLFCPL